jgi:tetratricopeptide (TPR) repeat protein
VKPVTPVAASEGPLLMPPAAPVPAPASGIVPTNPAAPPLAIFRPEALSPQSRKAPPPAAAAEKLVADLLRETPAPGAAPPLKLARSMVAPKVHPEVAAGYEALRQGDLERARRSYQAALAADPNGVDGLLGLATVEARAGDRANAARLYRKALTLDARNATALAGLATVADLSRPESLEPALKADIARYPQSAALQMTLGNLYASQSRWPEAQGAFFEAHRLEPQNADALYNLAVALDNLNQPRLALDYYRRALALAKGQAVQFDARGAERRLADLQR